MSQLSNNTNEMDNILTDLSEEYGLKMYKTQRTAPPAVPPKIKAYPQVPRSAVVSTLREPSYSSRISPAAINNNAPTYSNTLTGNMGTVYKDYANLSMPTIQNSRPLPLQPPANLSSRPLPPQPSNNLSSRPAALQPTLNPNSRASPLHPSARNPLKSSANQCARPLPTQNKNIYNVTYSNLPPYHLRDEDLPLPPPPPPSLSKTKYDTNQNHDEYLPPPSPVSSNYSELVRATANLNFNEDRTNYPPIYQNEYPVYGASQSSNYESLYEPINPRPHSNLSAQTSASLASYGHNPPAIAKPSPKEEEVDVLTDLLVKSISDSQDLDTFGTCVRCNDKVVGETSGCTAMGKVYHVKCFSCQHCHINLQGKPFYAVEGQPYCETDYYETLEKCSVCDMPILDRILRATGKPYHPSCFTCVMCGKSLDGIPFTVDAMNQIHCIEDFHKKFAPRCCVCELPIMPEEGEEETVRVVALDRSFHVRCYRCEDCGLLLTSEAEGRGCYPLDDHILCKNCNAHRVRLLTNVMTTDL